MTFPCMLTASLPTSLGTRAMNRSAAPSRSGKATINLAGLFDNLCNIRRIPHFCGPSVPFWSAKPGMISVQGPLFVDGGGVS